METSFLLQGVLSPLSDVIILTSNFWIPAYAENENYFFEKFVYSEEYFTYMKLQQFTPSRIALAILVRGYSFFVIRTFPVSANHYEVVKVLMESQHVSPHLTIKIYFVFLYNLYFRDCLS